jgi:serine/threonine protein kinase
MIRDALVYLFRCSHDCVYGRRSPHDTERVARLRREAEVLPSLNHSHIAAIYDFVESGTSP